MPQHEAKPWEKYQATSGPWAQYATRPLLTSPAIETDIAEMRRVKEEARQNPPGVFDPLIEGLVSPQAVQKWIEKVGYAVGDQTAAELDQMREAAIKRGDQTTARWADFRARNIRKGAATVSSLTSPLSVATLGAANYLKGPAGLAAAGLFAAQGTEALTAPQGLQETQADILERRLGGAGQVAMAVPGLKESVKPTARAIERTGQIAARTAQTIRRLGRRPEVAQSVVKEAMQLPPKAVIGAEDIFRAVAPVGSKPGFRGNMYAAAGDLAEIAQTLELKSARGGIRNPDLRARKALDAIKEHLSKMYREERAPQLERQGEAHVKLALSEDATNGLKFIQDTAGASADRGLAGKVFEAETIQLRDLDRLARVVNQELLSYEKLTADQRFVAQTTNPRIAGLKELDQALKRTLNEELRTRGEVGLDRYERRFAALSQIRDQLRSRLNAIELQRSIPVANWARTLMAGKSGVASASQAAVADVNIGRTIEKGFERLRESGLKPDRGKPGIPTPIKGLLPSPGSRQLPEQMPPIAAPPVSEIPAPIDVSAASDQPWPKMMSVNEVRSQAAQLKRNARALQEKAATAREPDRRAMLTTQADRLLARAKQLETTATERAQRIEEANRPAEPPKPRDEISEREMSIFQLLPARFGATGVRADQIIEQTGLPASEVSTALTDLELRGIVTRKESGGYVANRAPDTLAVAKAAKPEWEMNYSEWVDVHPEWKRGGGGSAYRRMIDKAVSEGKPVPEANLPAKPQARAVETPARQQPPAVAPAAKEPWQMTRAEWERELDDAAINWTGTGGESKYGMGRATKEGSFSSPVARRRFLRSDIPDHRIEALQIPATHYDVVEKALREGKPVPPDVLADYPDLAKAAPAVEAPTRKTVRDSDAYYRIQKDAARAEIFNSADAKTKARMMKEAKEEIVAIAQKTALEAPKKSVKEQLSQPLGRETYNALPAEAKTKVNESVQIYKAADFFAKKNWEDTYRLLRAAWKGLPIQEKLARAMKEQGEI